jgi:release factor-specific protein-(glutamine-N5) methyltransferase
MSNKKDNKLKTGIYIKIGGLALFNGLMLKSKKRECVLEQNSNEILIVSKKNFDDTSLKYKILINNIPILRGFINIFFTIKNSIPYIISSVQNIAEKITHEDEENLEVNKLEIYFGYAIAISLIFTFFYIIPNFISSYFGLEYRNILQAGIEFIMFLCYLLIIAKTKILNVLFEYHGAEHKVVNAYETYGSKNLTLENVKKSSRFHVRCGGNFVMYFVLLVLITTFLIPSVNLITKTLIQVAMTFLNIGIAYEIVMIFAKLPNRLKYIAYPAMSIQNITTREPSDDKIKLAIYTMNLCIGDKSQISLKEYIKRYVSENINNNEEILNRYDIKDVLRIVSHVTTISVDKLFLEMDNTYILVEDEIKIYNMLNKMYFYNIPLQYLTNKQVFFNEEYFVNESVLIPRSDSEILVQKAIEYIEKYELKTMIDMCTGSGCIGISVSINSSIEKSLLVDISDSALVVTRKNILGNKSEDKCSVINSNLFEKIMEKEEKYDIIISNPPYIPTLDIQKLESHVKKEPIIALDGGKSGLDIYIRIFNEAKLVLKDNGFLIFEIGFDQLESIKKLLSEYREYEFIESVKDLGGNDRVVVCRFHQI